MSDKRKQFDILAEQMKVFLRNRNWEQFHTPKNVAMSIAIEAAELMELFQWDNKNPQEVMQDENLMTKVKDEIADVLIYTLSMALSLKIDLFTAIQEKMARNEIRFPPKE